MSHPDHTHAEYTAALASAEEASAHLGSLADLVAALRALDASGHSCPDCRRPDAEDDTT